MEGKVKATDEQVSVPPKPGIMIAGKYRVERLIGKGGMGAVVAADDVELGRTVAIKFLLPEFLEYPEIVARFVREARAAVMIKSEFTVRIVEVGRLDNDTPYIVMEHLEGEDLAGVLRRGPLPVATAVDHVLQACEAIAEAHAHGIIHRDLKPENLFLTHRPDGSPAVKVLDFGISRFQDPRSSRPLTKLSDNIGSPLYMSPEQTESARHTDERSDIWSLGVTVYELLAGKSPFIASSLPEVVSAILTGEHKPLEAHRPDVPPALARAVDRCLEKEPCGRFQDVAEFALALAPFGSDEARVSAQRIARIPGVSLHPPPELETGSARTRRDAETRRRIVRRILAAVALLAGTASLGIGVAWIHRQTQTAPAATASDPATEPDTGNDGPAPSGLDTPSAGGPDERRMTREPDGGAAIGVPGDRRHGQSDLAARPVGPTPKPPPRAPDEHTLNKHAVAAAKVSPASQRDAGTGRRLNRAPHRKKRGSRSRVPDDKRKPGDGRAGGKERRADKSASPLEMPLD